MNVPDLFGGESPLRDPVRSPYQKKKSELGYRLARPMEPTCKTCVHRIHKNMNDKTYYKCALIGDSNNFSTDIRLKNTCNIHTHKVEA